MLHVPAITQVDRFGHLVEPHEVVMTLNVCATHRSREAARAGIIRYFAVTDHAGGGKGADTTPHEIGLQFRAHVGWFLMRS